MKIIEIRKLSTQQLTSETVKLRDEIVDMRRRLYLGELQNVKTLRTKRKDLARYLTVLGEQLAKEAK